MVDEVDLENRTTQWINDISLFNNKHIMQCYNITQSTIPEESCYISCLTPTGFINGKDESGCYVNSSFQVLFFNIYFRQLIMNIDCEKMINNFDDSGEHFRSYFEKIVILRVVQKIFCEMLIGRRNFIYTDSFFDVTNIKNKCAELFIRV